MLGGELDEVAKYQHASAHDEHCPADADICGSHHGAHKRVDATDEQQRVRTCSVVFVEAIDEQEAHHHDGAKPQHEAVGIHR